MDKAWDRFFDHYVGALEDGDAALFAGAGLSRASGFVDWKGLLRNVAEELNLDVDVESDLVALAQYHVNERASRSRLNRLLIEEFTKTSTPTAAHDLITDLPIRTIWTTNYDTLLEDSFRRSGKRPDVKITQANLARTLPKRDVTIYKMHGDVSQPQDAVLTKDDYEMYEEARSLFTATLKGDLVSKTFLFVGFSFTDPNIDWILGRIRSLLGQNQREHYCIMKRLGPIPTDAASRAKYDYEQTKMALRIADLRRYSIEALLIDEYSDVLGVLKTLVARVDSRNVFVGGSAAEAGTFGRHALEELANRIGKEIIRRGYNVISGFGLGLGATVLAGAMEATLSDDRTTIADRAILRPFPGASADYPDLREAYSRHRRQMLKRARFAIFLAGNRLSRDGQVEAAAGVVEEFEIAKSLGVVPIPVGATGYVAEAIWREVAAEQERFFGQVDVRNEISALNTPGADTEQLCRAVFGLIDKLQSAS